MSLRLATLALLSARPMTGYELVKYFDDSVGLLWAAPHSQLYPELRRMEVDGLVQGQAVARGLRATKRIYSITPAGECALARMVEEVAPYPPERDVHRLKVAYAEWGSLDTAQKQLQAHLDYYRWRRDQWNRLLEQARDVTFPLLQERLSGIAADKAERAVAFKVFAFEGQVARADAEIEWARRGLRLVTRLERQDRAPEGPAAAADTGKQVPRTRSRATSRSSAGGDSMKRAALPRSKAPSTSANAALSKSTSLDKRAP